MVAGRKKTVTDGPFTESKELVSGYLVVKAADMKAAAEMAKGCPALELEHCSVEVREIREMKI